MNEHSIFRTLLVVLGIGILTSFILSSIIPGGDGLGAAILLGVVCLVAVFYACSADIENN